LRVAVIGGAGRMGKWLAEYFLNQGHCLVISDTRRDEAEAFANSIRAELALDNGNAAMGSDLTVVSTPIDVAPKVLEEISPRLKKHSTIMEISSLKCLVIPILQDIAEHGIVTLSVHPLFGPGVQRLAQEKVALVPILDPSSELRTARKLFPGAEIVVVESGEHDRAMALTLSLPHFVNIALASVIGEEDTDVLKKLGGTTFKIQLMLCEAVMAEDPDLYSSIQMGNIHTGRYLDRFMISAENLRRHIADKDARSFAQFYADVRSSLSRDADFANAYERMYKALAAL